MELNKKLKELYERTESNDRKCKPIKYGDLISLWFGIGEATTRVYLDRIDCSVDDTMSWNKNKFNAITVFDFLLVAHTKLFVDFAEANKCAQEFIDLMEDNDIFVSKYIRAIYRGVLVKRTVASIRRTLADGEIITEECTTQVREEHDRLSDLALDTFVTLKAKCQPTWRSTLSYIMSDKETCDIFNDSIDIDFMWVYFLMYIYGAMNLEKDLNDVNTCIKRALKHANFDTIVGGGK